VWKNGQEKYLAIVQIFIIALKCPKICKKTKISA